MSGTVACASCKGEGVGLRHLCSALENGHDCTGTEVCQGTGTAGERSSRSKGVGSAGRHQDRRGLMQMLEETLSCVFTGLCH